MNDSVRVEGRVKKKSNISEGAVTFLDVLGWKGKWREGYEAINILSGLIQSAEKLAEVKHTEATTRFGANGERLRGKTTNILSISDTIAIFTEGPAEPTLAIHGAICQMIIPESILLNIPIRGATSYGTYSTSGNIMIGPAIDEAASWHELTNWIGVTLTPSSKYAVNGAPPEEWGIYPKIPYKKRVDSLTYCVNWEMERKEAISCFQKMGPHVPEIAEKYLNTLEFLEFREKQKNMVEEVQ